MESSRLENASRESHFASNMSFPSLVYFIIIVISNTSPLPGETLITDFSDLYKNSLGYNQDDDGTLNVYQKLAGGGARFNFKDATTVDSYWYSMLMDGSQNQCTNGTGAIFRIVGADFKNNSLWFTFDVRPPKDMLCSATTSGLLVRKYFDAKSFLTDEISGRDYVDIDLDSYNSDLRKLHSIALVFIPNIDITIYSITLRYKKSTSSTVETISSTFSPVDGKKELHSIRKRSRKHVSRAKIKRQNNVWVHNLTYQVGSRDAQKETTISQFVEPGF